MERSRTQTRRPRQTPVVVACLMAAAAVLSAQTAGRKIDPNDPLTVPRITMADFQKLHAAGGVLVVDVREQIAFESGHIPGAVHAPIARIEKQARALGDRAKGRPIVTYCSCPSEHSSAEAALLLYKKGLTDVRALVGGYPQWVITGGVVERGGE